jgi:hypothetical protein
MNSKEKKNDYVNRFRSSSFCKKNLVRKLESNRPFGRLGRRWKDNIRMDLRKIMWEVVDWIHVALDREQWRDLVDTVVNLRFKRWGIF